MISKQHNHTATPFTTLCILLAILLIPSLGHAEAIGPGVAFHLDTDTHMNRALRQVAHQLNATPDIPIHVIMIASAVNAVLDGAKDATGGLYTAQLEQLLAGGVRIFACENTLDSFNKTPDDLTFGIETERSGIVALTERQRMQHFAYQKL